MMSLFSFINAALLLITCTASVARSAQFQADAGQTTQERACDELRREMTALFQQVYDKKTRPNPGKKLLPNWVEFYLLVICGKQQQKSKFNSLSATDGGAPLGTVDTPDAIYTKSLHARPKRESDDGSLYSDNSLSEELSRVRRSAYGSDMNEEATLHRQKRFLNGATLGGGPDFGGMSLGSINPTPARGEISESAQMMNSLLMLSKFQKNSLAREYSPAGQRGYIGDRISFGSGMYGDTYPGKRKRESGLEPATLSRKKRFLFFGEPTEAATAPSLFNIMLGTAQDPNTGKRLEMGGDVMKNAMGNMFLSFLPPSMQPPPGKEPGDFVKNFAPLWFSTALGSPGTVKKRNRNGLFGDNVPGRRGKRSSEGSFSLYESQDPVAF